jgi:hypothetical protein
VLSEPAGAQHIPDDLAEQDHGTPFAATFVSPGYPQSPPLTSAPLTLTRFAIEGEPWWTEIH